MSEPEITIQDLEVGIHNYVMVPVPDQYVPHVMRHILLLVTRDSIRQWEPEEVESLFASIDELAKAVLAGVARSTLSELEVTVDDVSDKTQVPLSEVMKIVRDLNDGAKKNVRPRIIEPRTTNDTLASGREVTRRYLDMHPRLAQMVADAEKADRLANPHVLPGSA